MGVFFLVFKQHNVAVDRQHLQQNASVTPLHHHAKSVFQAEGGKCLIRKGLLFYLRY